MIYHFTNFTDSNNEHIGEAISNHNKNENVCVDSRYNALSAKEIRLYYCHFDNSDYNWQACGWHVLVLSVM